MWSIFYAKTPQLIDYVRCLIKFTKLNSGQKERKHSAVNKTPNTNF